MSVSEKALVCLFAVLLMSVTVVKISDYDFWWHLKLGETIYSSGQIYSLDTFSYTFLGAPQFRAEWLGNLIIYMSYRMGGFIGIALLKMVLVGLTFWFLFLALRKQGRGEGASIAAVLATLALVLFAIRFRLFLRPYLFSFMFFSLFLLLTIRFQEKPGKFLFVLLPVIQVLWANISVGAIFGPALVFMAIARQWQVDPEGRINGIVMLALVGAASLLNPEGVRIYSLLFSALVHSPYKETLGEHQPVSFRILWGYGLKYTAAFQILALAAAAYLILMKGWKNIFHAALFLFFLPIALLQIRMIDFFSLGASVVAFPAVNRLIWGLPPVRSRALLVNAGLAAVLILCVLFSTAGPTYAVGIGVKDDIFPDGALAFLDREGVEGKMMNSYAFGGYLIWASPGRKVFIDGRHRHLYTPEFYNAYHDALKSREAWEAAERKWGFDYAVLEYDQRSMRFPTHLKDNPDWALVYWDNQSAVFLKRSAGNAHIIAKHEYKVAKPNFYDFSYLDDYLHAKTAPQLIEQLGREIAMNPANQEPLLARAFLLYNMGPSYHRQAQADIVLALRLKPDLAMEHSALAGILFQGGAADQAAQEARKALALDPADPTALWLKKKLGL